MSDALGRMYAERYFPAEQKARVETIVGNVIAAFRQRVESATWMSPGTRTQALAKLKTLYFGIGYPEHGRTIPTSPWTARTPWAIFGGSRTATTVVPWLGWAGPWT